MSLSKASGDIPDLKKQRSRKNAIPKALEKPRRQPRSVELPAVVVRVKQFAEAVALINIPRSDTGADLVLYMIGAHPDVAALTTDGAYVNFGDIVSIEKPSCEAILIEEAKKAAPKPPGTNAWIPVRHAARMKRETDGTITDILIQICNIPDSEGGRELLQEIFREYSSRDVYEYTLYTSERDVVPVWSLADANGHKR
ncbi:MAG: hypothetical protein WC866_02655 [Patescibacteria group bacterium]|jgi:hypothetical protein